MQLDLEWLHSTWRDVDRPGVALLDLEWRCSTWRGVDRSSRHVATGVGKPDFLKACRISLALVSFFRWPWPHLICQNEANRQNVQIEISNTRYYLYGEQYHLKNVSSIEPQCQIGINVKVQSLLKKCPIFCTLNKSIATMSQQL